MKYHISGAKINKCFDFAKYLGRFFGARQRNCLEGWGQNVPGNGGYSRGRMLRGSGDVQSRRRVQP